ncbi:hypothetical protein AAFF_G00094990 [Aldrovandia affinis]|uniref:Uncharacterized protein n=1 Tax=Aldrovandia affinis TaxID=143900 RepID=A0AAD7RVV3_9TELE|nr:hypothetical protein AAFF_G00094990 [Aldrovandia affinis]
MEAKHLFYQLGYLHQSIWEYWESLQDQGEANRPADRSACSFDLWETGGVLALMGDAEAQQAFTPSARVPLASRRGGVVGDSVYEGHLLRHRGTYSLGLCLQWLFCV